MLSLSVGFSPGSGVMGRQEPVRGATCGISARCVWVLHALLSMRVCTKHGAHM